MKLIYFILLIVVLAGCSTTEIHPYNLGCRDGINRWERTHGRVLPAVYPSYVDLYCDSLDYERRAKEHERERPDRGGRK